MKKHINIVIINLLRNVGGKKRGANENRGERYYGRNDSCPLTNWIRGETTGIHEFTTSPLFLNMQK
jgi:hypothetical protein